MYARVTLVGSFNRAFGSFPAVRDLFQGVDRGFLDFQGSAAGLGIKDTVKHFYLLLLLGELATVVIVADATVAADWPLLLLLMATDLVELRCTTHF